MYWSKIEVSLIIKNKTTLWQQLKCYLEALEYSPIDYYLKLVENNSVEINELELRIKN